MPAAVKDPAFSNASLVVVGLAFALAGAFGAALLQRGPEKVVLPEMAPRPVMTGDNRKLFVQRYEVTISEWNRCAADGACELTLRPRADQDPDATPATGLSFVDVQQYVHWINAKTAQRFRLPTAQEWNTMAASVLPDAPDPLFTDPSLTWASSYLIEGLAPRALKPRGSFSTSPEGVVDLDGSVWEWTMECYDGSSAGAEYARCPAFFVGGEHLAAMSYLVRDPARGGCAVGTPPAHLGLRLVSDTAI